MEWIPQVGFPIVMVLLMFAYIQKRDERSEKTLAARDEKFERVLARVNRSLQLLAVLIANSTGQQLEEVRRTCLLEDDAAS